MNTSWNGLRICSRKPLVTHQGTLGIFAVHVAEKDHPYRSRRLCKETTQNASVRLHRMIISTNPTNLVSYRLNPLYELWRPRSSPVSNDPIDFPELFCLWGCRRDCSSRRPFLAFVSMWVLHCNTCANDASGGRKFPKKHRLDSRTLYPVLHLRCKLSSLTNRMAVS